MTTVTVTERDGLTIHVHGHAGHSTAGTDIVCAAVTSAVRFLDCALSDELGLDTHPVIKPETASITLQLDKAQAAHPTAQIIVAAFRRYIRQLALEHPRNVRIMED